MNDIPQRTAIKKILITKHWKNAKVIEKMRNKGGIVKKYDFFKNYKILFRKTVYFFNKVRIMTKNMKSL